MRHGSVSYFDRAAPAASETERGLSPKGVEEARAAGEALRDVAFDRVVTSGLRRTAETAEIVLGRRALQVESKPELAEIRSGALHAIPVESAEAVFRLAFRGVVRSSRFLEGDEFGPWADRVAASFDGVCADRSWGTMLAVLHGAVNRLLIARALGLALDDALPLHLDALEQEPACINVLDLEDDGRIIVRLLNFTPGTPVKAGVHDTTMEALYRAFRET